MITEAFVTIEIKNHLVKNGWEILSYDFPQSGTGILLKPHNSKEKIKETIKPDIIAVKGDKGILLENKDRFHLPDFKKIEKLRTTDLYVFSLAELFGGIIPKKMWYGIGIPHIEYQIQKSQPYFHMIDVLVTVTKEKQINIIYSNPKFDF